MLMKCILKIILIIIVESVKIIIGCLLLIYIDSIYSVIRGVFINVFIASEQVIGVMLTSSKFFNFYYFFF